MSLASDVDTTWDAYVAACQAYIAGTPGGQGPVGIWTIEHARGDIDTRVGEIIVRDGPRNFGTAPDKRTFVQFTS